jgi:hypothetical protein
MTSGVDLNDLRTRVLNNQNRRNDLPQQQQEKVLVTNEGRIVMGRDVDADETRELAEVHQGVFAS